MTSITYEIVRREANQHRPGFAALLIEGLDVDITVNPGQFLPKALREAAAEGKTGGELAIRAEEICQEYARRAIQRRIDRLKLGIPVDKKQRSGMVAGTASDMGRVKRLSEEKSVETYLNRGHLCGLDKAQREARMVRRAQKIDCDRDWQERRAKLILECQAELTRWEQELASWEAHKKSLPAERAKLLLEPKAVKNVAELRDRLRGLQPRAMAASHGFQSAYAQYLTEGVQLATDDIRIWPLMTDTTADIERDGKDTFSELTTTDEFDGSNYSAGGLALDSQAVAEDDANDRAEFDAADEVVTALGAGTRSIQGVALGLFNTNTAGSRILHWIEFASNKTPDGSDFTFAFNAEGILQAADG